VKYIILLGDGMGDYPLEELYGKTPLMVSRTPHMDFLVKNGMLGLVRTIPEGFPPGSDVANLSIIGYDPKEHYTGRAPLEAASLNIQLGPGDIAYRCNLVTLTQKDNECFMEDFSAGHISNEEAREIIHSINKELGDNEFSFYPGVSYRHIMVWKGGKSGIQTTPPHDISGKDIDLYLPKGDGAENIIELMKKSKKILAQHPVNQRRKREARNPATSIWLWGQGKPPKIPSFDEKYHCQGAVISAVDLIKGIGISAGLEPIDVPGATGYLDTNYRGKAEYALNALKDKDFVYVHVEAPDEAAHSGNIKDKIKAIEAFDDKVVGTILENSKHFPSLRIMVLPDHATPIRLKTHTSDPVPFVIYPSFDKRPRNNFQTFDEESASESELFFTEGHKLMNFFILEKLNKKP